MPCSNGYRVSASASAVSTTLLISGSAVKSPVPCLPHSSTPILLKRLHIVPLTRHGQRPYAFVRFAKLPQVGKFCMAEDEEFCVVDDKNAHSIHQLANERRVVHQLVFEELLSITRTRSETCGKNGRVQWHWTFKDPIDQTCRLASRTQQSVVTVLTSISQLTIHQSCCQSRHQWFSRSCVCRRLFSCCDFDATHEPMPAVDHCQLSELVLFSGGPIDAVTRRFRGQGKDPTFLFGHSPAPTSRSFLPTCCTPLAIFVLQSLAVNAAKVESDVLHCASLADPCEMESLAVKVHICHCCVSVGLLTVQHLCCTRDELDLGFSMLPWHSMAEV